MKYFAFLITFSFLFIGNVTAQKLDNPWSTNQLMQPADLAQRITAKENGNTLILSIGFDDPILHSIEAGPGNSEEGLAQLKAYLKDVSKDKAIVIYCGCCPMEKCPNIRPAFTLLEQLGYKNVKLLELRTSVKADWMDKGYPVKEK